jgi:hypothetical protein
MVNEIRDFLKAAAIERPASLIGPGKFFQDLGPAGRSEDLPH